MKQHNLSMLIQSIGRSIDEAVSDMNSANFSCELEEFECTLDLNMEVDTKYIGFDKKTKKIKGLKLAEIEKKININQAKKVSQSETKTLTIRAVFSPKIQEE